jgi:hypothetical protein
VSHEWRVEGIVTHSWAQAVDIAKSISKETKTVVDIEVDGVVKMKAWGNHIFPADHPNGDDKKVLPVAFALILIIIVGVLIAISSVVGQLNQPINDGATQTIWGTWVPTPPEGH